MQESRGTRVLNSVIKDAAIKYVKRLFSQSGDSDLIRVLKKESFKRTYKKMILDPDEFKPLPRPTEVEPWHGRKPDGPEDFLKSKVVLPSLPQVQIKLQQIIDNPDSSLKDLTRVISMDPKLVASVMRLANSKMFSFETAVDTPAKAVERLGFKEASSLALGTVSLSLFKRSKIPILSVEKFWKHSIACGVISQEIARFMELGEPDRFFVNGMLHDIGLYVIFESDYGLALELLDLAKIKGNSISNAEVELLGFSHATLGEVILRGWSSPSSLIAAVAGHHTPEKVKNDIDVMVTHIADFIARALGYDLGVSSILGFLDNDAWESIGLSGEQFMDLLPEIQFLIEDTFSILNHE